MARALLCYLTDEGKRAVLIGPLALYYGLFYLSLPVLASSQSALLTSALRLLFALPLVLTAGLGLFFRDHAHLLTQASHP